MICDSHGYYLRAVLGSNLRMILLSIDMHSHWAVEQIQSACNPWHRLLDEVHMPQGSDGCIGCLQRPVRDEAAYKARAGAALSVREKLLEVVKKLTTEVEATIARCELRTFRRFGTM